MLVFEERGKPEYPEKNLSEQRREPTTNSTHIWRRRLRISPGPHWWEESALTIAPSLARREHFHFLREPGEDLISTGPVTEGC